jgi:subtilisin family serine protease
MKIVARFCLSLALLGAATRAEQAAETFKEDRSTNGGGLRGSGSAAAEEDPHRHLFEPGASVARVWIKYKKGKKRGECVQSIKSLVIATGAASDESSAKAFVTPDKDRPSFAAKSFSGEAAPFQMHFEFFGQQEEAVVASVDKSMLSALAADPNVVSISKDEKRYFFNSIWSTPLTEQEHRELQAAETVPDGVKLVQAESVWALGYKGTGVKVCVIDSGIDKGHPEYNALTMTGLSTSAGTWNTDGNGHGTHCAGTIAARANSVGVVGVAPEAVVVPVKVFDNNGDWAYSSDVVDAAVECQKLGANIVSMSLGGSGSSTLEYEMFKTLHSQGVVSIAAAGNSGNSALSYPASYDVVLSVAATDNSKVKADFSQFNRLVDISAPGVDVLSTVPRATVTNGYPYEKWSGTSMATPHVAGVAALLRQKSPTASATAIMNAITSTAQDLGAAGRDDSYGHGFIRALNALNALGGVGTTPSTRAPTKRPTKLPTRPPVKAPTKRPTKAPVKRPTRPTKRPVKKLTRAPVRIATKAPTKRPTKSPTKVPTKAPTKRPTKAPTRSPTSTGTMRPTRRPTLSPTTCDDWYYYC